MGVGSDGILWGPLPSKSSEFGLRIFNPDGSEAENQRLIEVMLESGDLLRLNDAGQKALLTDWLHGCYTAASLEEALAQRDKLKAGDWSLAMGNPFLLATDFNIAASNGDISGADLSSNLEQSNVTILNTSGTTGTAGNVNVNDAVGWSAGTTLTLDAQNQIMGQYARLQAFPEVRDVLQALRTRGLKLAILSNGNPQMLDAAVSAAGLSAHLDAVLSVDAVRKFKTAPDAYQLGLDRFGAPARDILFVSSNGWDVCGAAWFGYQTFWVNRADAPMEELGVVPQAIGRSLNDLLTFIGKGDTK